MGTRKRKEGGKIMKKLILALILMVAVSYAANEYLFTTWWADSAFQNKEYELWEQYFCDTFTLDGLNGDTIIDIGSPAYNPAIRSLNATAESCWYDVSFDTEKSFFLADSFARNNLAHSVGITAGVGNQNWLISPIKFEKIYMRPGFPGADVGVDSTVKFELRFMR
jgi:hypothetical protein